MCPAFLLHFGTGEKFDVFPIGIKLFDDRIVFDRLGTMGGLLDRLNGRYFCCDLWIAGRCGPAFSPDDKYLMRYVAIVTVLKDSHLKCSRMTR